MDLFLTQQDGNNLHFGIAFPVDSYCTSEFPLQHCKLHFRNQNSPINKEIFCLVCKEERSKKSVVTFLAGVEAQDMLPLSLHSCYFYLPIQLPKRRTSGRLHSF